MHFFFIIKNLDSRPEALEFSKVNKNEDKDRFEGTIVDGNLKFGTLVATLWSFFVLIYKRPK